MNRFCLLFLMSLSSLIAAGEKVMRYCPTVQLLDFMSQDQVVTACTEIVKGVEDLFGL